MANKWGKCGNGVRFHFLGLQIYCRWWWQLWYERHLFLGIIAITSVDSVFKSRDITLLTSLYSQRNGFSSSHVWMWALDHKEGWAPKNWCFQNVVLEKTLKSPLDRREIKPVNPQGNEPWIFIGRTDAAAEAPILQPPDAKSWPELEQTLGDGEGQEAWSAELQRIGRDLATE